MTNKFKEVAQALGTFVQAGLKHLWEKHVCADMPEELYQLEFELSRVEHRLH